MARKYTYIDFKTKKVLYKKTHPNYVSDDDVNKLFLKETGRDYRLEKGVIDRKIVMEND